MTEKIKIYNIPKIVPVSGRNMRPAPVQDCPIPKHLPTNTPSLIGVFMFGVKSIPNGAEMVQDTKQEKYKMVNWNKVADVL